MAEAGGHGLIEQRLYSNSPGVTRRKGSAKELVVVIFGYLATNQGAASHTHMAKTYTALRVSRRRRGSLAAIL